LGNEELFKQIDLWTKYKDGLSIYDDHFDLYRGFILSIDGSNLYFANSSELKTLLKCYKRAGETRFARPNEEVINISTVDNYYKIAEFKLDFDKNEQDDDDDNEIKYYYKWQVTSEWYDVIGWFKRNGFIKNEC
jgi:hypothetical protein